MSIVKKPSTISLHFNIPFNFYKSTKCNHIQYTLNALKIQFKLSTYMAMHAKILFIFSVQLNFLLQQKIPVRVCLLVVRSNKHSNLYINRLFFVIKTNLNCYLPIKNDGFVHHFLLFGIGIFGVGHIVQKQCAILQVIIFKHFFKRIKICYMFIATIVI